MRTVLLYTGNANRRKNWAHYLDEGYDVITAGSFDALIAQMETNPGALVLFHYSTRKGDYREVAEAAEALSPRCSLIVLSDRPMLHEGRYVLALGARGYANARMSAVLIRQALDVAAEGNVWLNPEFVQDFIAHGAAEVPSPELPETLADLTERERDLALLVAQGLSNRQIGEKLSLAERTVKNQLSGVYAKMGVKDRIALALKVNRGTA